MLVLVINSGSSSLKFQLLDMETEEVISKGVVVESALVRKPTLPCRPRA